MEDNNIVICDIRQRYLTRHASNQYRFSDVNTEIGDEHATTGVTEDLHTSAKKLSAINSLKQERSTQLGASLINCCVQGFLIEFSADPPDGVAKKDTHRSGRCFTSRCAYSNA